MKKIAVAVVLAMGLSVAEAAWRNLNDGAYYSGPKLTEADLAGKVVLVDCWGVNCPPCRALLPRMQDLWKSFKNKPFVLVGSHRQGRQPEKVKELVEANKLTFPIYDYFGIAEGEPSFRGIPFLYVVNHRGKVVYSGHDERAATEAIVSAIADVGGPVSLCGGVSMVKFKMFKKKLRLGLPIKSEVKKLQEATKGRNEAVAEEANAILKAIAEAKSETKAEIDSIKATKPEEAVKLIKLFCTTFPEDAAEYKAELPELQKAAAEAKKAAKTK